MEFPQLYDHIEKVRVFVEPKIGEWVTIERWSNENGGRDAMYCIGIAADETKRPEKRVVNDQRPAPYIDPPVNRKIFFLKGSEAKADSLKKSKEA